MPVQETVITTGWDKANHCLAFAVLLALLDNAYPAIALWSKKLPALLIYAVLIEIIQAFIPLRHFSLLDIVADASGLSLYLFVRPWISRKLSLIRLKGF